jgi:dTDP-glucose pyrophosphorylase
LSVSIIQPNWKECLLPKNSTLKEVIANLEKTGLKISLIIDRNEALIGVITDGDIRRSLIKHKSLEIDALKIMNKNFRSAHKDDKKKFIEAELKQYDIQQIPIIDDENRVVGLRSFSTNIEVKKLPNTLVIMAGGFGKRLKPYTDSVPKPMVHIDGKPILEHIIDNAKLYGFHKFTICIFHLGEIIKDYFDNGSNHNIQIDYIEENEPLGTGGALSLIDEVNEPFIVTNGDVITDIEYSKLLRYHKKNKAVATMAVKRHEIKNPFGVVNLNSNGSIVGFDEKPSYVSYVNAGVYAFNPEVLDLLNKNEHINTPDIFLRLISQNFKVIAFPVHEQWVDIGTPEVLKAIKKNDK